MLWKPLLLLLAAGLCGAAAPQASLHGKLVQQEGKPPGVDPGGHKLVYVEGEPETLAVLGDQRLAGSEVELAGQFKDPEHFAVGPFYASKSIFVWKDGKKHTVSYWCPVCSIRAYTPGKCVCCQQETHLDLQEVK